MKQQPLRTRILLHLLEEGQSTAVTMRDMFGASSREMHSRISESRRAGLIKSGGSRGVYGLTDKGVDEALRLDGNTVNTPLLNAAKEVIGAARHGGDQWYNTPRFITAIYDLEKIVKQMEQSK